MFLDDIRLVTEMTTKYAALALKPTVDMGGLAKPTIADYDLTIKTGDQRARYVYLANNARPFDHIDPDYVILNPEKGDAPIEEVSATMWEHWGTIICLNVVEHVENPFRVFEALRMLLQLKGLLIVSTVFSFPYHPSPRDYWRYSPDCLKMLCETAGLKVLEYDWRLTVTADKGVKEIHTGEPQEVRSVYVVATR